MKLNLSGMTEYYVGRHVFPVQYTLIDDNKYKTIHQPVIPFTFTLLMRVTAELIYTHIDDLIWSFVKKTHTQKKTNRVYYIQPPHSYLFSYKRERNALSIIVSHHHSSDTTCRHIDGNANNNKLLSMELIGRDRISFIRQPY